MLLLRRQVQLQHASMLPRSVAPLESSCQPCKARLPSQPVSVLSIVSIDCCPTANCNPLFEPSFLHLISNVAASVYFQIWALANVFCMSTVNPTATRIWSLSAVCEPFGPRVSIPSATPDLHHRHSPHSFIFSSRVALTSRSALAME